MNKFSLFSTCVISLTTTLFLGILSVSVVCGQDATASNGWMAPQEEADRPNPVKADAASIERGKGLFMEYCTTCHGEEGRGDGPVAARLPVETPDLSETAGTSKDGDLAWKIANGKSGTWFGTSVRRKAGSAPISTPSPATSMSAAQASGPSTRA